MGNFFKNNDFKTDYKKRPNDEYKHLYNQLDEETKKKFARQRSFVLVGVVIVVLALIIILAVTGIGTNKAETPEVFYSFSFFIYWFGRDICLFLCKWWYF